MKMFWNPAKVKNLTSWGVSLFMVSLMLTGFGVGVLACRYWPRMVMPLGYPAMILGLVLCLVMQARSDG